MILSNYSYYEPAAQASPTLGGLIFGFVLAAFAYGLVPIIYANATLGVTKAKYNLVCWGSNFVVFFILRALGTNGGGLIIWTLIMTVIGKSILRKNDRIIETKKEEDSEES